MPTSKHSALGTSQVASCSGLQPLISWPAAEESLAKWLEMQIRSPTSAHAIGTSGVGPGVRVWLPWAVVFENHRCPVSWRRHEIKRQQLTKQGRWVWSCQSPSPVQILPDQSLPFKPNPGHLRFYFLSLTPHPRGLDKKRKELNSHYN